MDNARSKISVWRSIVLVFVLAFMLNIPSASGHSYPNAYYRGTSPPVTNPDWMADLPDDLLISELSIPGTHDTMADCCGVGPQTQTMDLPEQLISGLRAFDIRLRSIENVFAIHHSYSFLDVFFGDVLDDAISFLNAHPDEIIVMSVQKASDVKSASTLTFEDIFRNYMRDYSSHIWLPNATTGFDSQGFSLMPTLGEVRGKIVFINGYRGGFGSSLPQYVLRWQNDYVQNDWSPPNLYSKWEDVKTHMNNSNTRIQTDKSNLYMSFLSASGLHFPYFWAGGHASEGEGAIRLVTGSTTADCNSSCLSDLPRGACLGEWCSIYNEGINILTYEYLNGTLTPYKGTPYDTSHIKFVGILLMDFPGGDLINTIIQLNPWNYPPIANAGGSYIVDEGSIVNFDASNSIDEDGDTMQYRWDIDDDGTWDTEWNTAPQADFIWDDDYTGTVEVEVTDSKHTDNDSTSVTVNNVAPTVKIDQIADGKEFILTNLAVNFAGSFTDPGADDHSGMIKWGDGSSFPYMFPTTSPVNNVHFYTDAGDYNVLFTITDDDLGTNTASALVKIVTPAEAASEAIEELQLINDRDVGRALVDLEGANNGKGKGGALDHLENDDINAALVKIGKALEDLIKAEEGDVNLDLSETKKLLTVIARSATVEMIQDAESASVTAEDQANSINAKALYDEGVVLLEAGDYLGAVSKFQDALRQAQDISGLSGAAGRVTSSEGLFYLLYILMVIVLISVLTNRNSKNNQI